MIHLYERQLNKLPQSFNITFYSIVLTFLTSTQRKEKREKKQIQYIPEPTIV